MDAIAWLFGANIIIWLGLGAYLAYLGHNQKRIRKQLQELELNSDDN